MRVSLHTKSISLIEVRVEDKLWYNLNSGYNEKKSEFSGVEVFTNPDKAVAAFYKIIGGKQ